MPRRKINVSKRKQPSARNIARRFRRKRNSDPSFKSTVHRRLVLYPNVQDASWLSKLAWYASVALKLFKLAVGVSDDLTVDEAITGSGSVILLGPGDFAAMSPMAVPVKSDAKTDNEVKVLKCFPFERAALSRISVRISPSVDLGSRGGMYAAVIVPVDATDAAMASEPYPKDESTQHTPNNILQRYSCSYDDIIKHPNAKMAPVTRSLSLQLNLAPVYHNIRIIWSDDTGYVNAYPNCAILIAFSDLASKQSGVDSNYGPNKSLFEIHMTGSLGFKDPGDLITDHESGAQFKSNYTPLVCVTNRTNKNTHKAIMPYQVSFFDHHFTSDRPIDLRTIPLEVAEEMLAHYGRLDLLPKLRLERGLQDMELK